MKQQQQQQQQQRQRHKKSPIVVVPHFDDVTYQRNKKLEVKTQRDNNERFHGIRVRSTRYLEREFTPENSKTARNMTETRNMAERLLEEIMVSKGEMSNPIDR